MEGKVMRWLLAFILVAMPLTISAAERPTEKGGDKTAKLEQRKADKEQERGTPELREHERLAREAAKWQDRAAEELQELKEQLEKVSGATLEALQAFIAAREEQIRALAEKIEAHRTGDWGRVQEADQRLGGLEEKQQTLALDLEEAQTVADMRARAKTHDIEDKIEPLIDQVRENFDARRDVRRELARLQKRRERLHRQREIIMKRLEITVLESQLSDEGGESEVE